ncbi:M20/M25/M40 family metallo-hydrolase [Bradyrhizobium sp.]|jgi:tripeptide aminopeptidase|uniref:M20/M25/M40 family metallo-hydrolase n=1 Tax=Bradyrhizobium sp. TaxID=376 RepID=UPI002DDD30EE|nr:M20/M25/M40 family metallo-hydrolase [Bradyrhizobium sp.]HEV2153709.1 M20/M25/M40 family metallo-hydrolase [Bradyrhizobium sp.]
MPVDHKAATDRLMRFLAVEGVTGQEAAIGRELAAALQEVGVPKKAIRLDDANSRIPVPTETGNLIVDLPGRGALHNQPRIMFMTHMDTVPLCAGAKPKISGRKIVNEAKTALGGDNRTGCGVLVTLAAELAKQKLDHPPITLLFCVREESGLYGARHVKLEELGSPVMAFNYDGGSASNVIIGAVGADRWTVEIFGRASHAGVAPERGISSTMIMALALAEVKAGGWFGKVVKGKLQGTSNVGPVTGGEGRPAGDATNVVTDYVHVRGESRSHDGKFFKEITKAYKAAFEKAAKKVTNTQGKSGKVKFKAETDYFPFRMKESLPVVKRAIEAVTAVGGTPNVRAANGGLDANWMVRHGIPTVTFGAGQNEAHTVDEWINLDEYDRGCALALQVATMR